jgi:hypothetical protein
MSLYIELFYQRKLVRYYKSIKSRDYKNASLVIHSPCDHLMGGSVSDKKMFTLHVHVRFYCKFSFNFKYLQIFRKTIKQRFILVIHFFVKAYFFTSLFTFQCLLDDIDCI